jgi:hypothetical protein
MIEAIILSLFLDVSSIASNSRQAAPGVFRTPPSLRGLDRIETVIQDETGKKAGIEITLPREQRWKGMIPRR